MVSNFTQYLRKELDGWERAEQFMVAEEDEEELEQGFSVLAEVSKKVVQADWERGKVFMKIAREKDKGIHQLGRRVDSTFARQLFGVRPEQFKVGWESLKSLSKPKSPLLFGGVGAAAHWNIAVQSESHEFVKN